MFQAPARTAASPKPSVVQGGGNTAHAMAALPEAMDLPKDYLLDWVGLDVLPVGAKPVAEANVSHPLAVGALVAHRVARPFADRLALPLAYRRHDIQHQPAGGRAGVQGFGHRD